MSTETHFCHASLRGCALHRLAAIAVVSITFAAGCGDSSQAPDAAPLADADPNQPDAFGGTCPWDGVRGSGRHRLFLQGQNADPDDRGVYPMLHEWKRPSGEDAELCDDRVFVEDTNGDGVWQPGEAPKNLGPGALVHGEHYLVGAGAFVEFAITLCEDITGDVAFYIPNFDVTGSRALHQLFVVHEGTETLIAETIDDEAGQNGYNPFVRVMAGTDPVAVAGDELLLRSTNLNGFQFSVMVFNPPSEYESWVLVTVP